MGEITLAFSPDKAPNHVRNFLRLAQAGLYDGMSFHRVVKGFVIQSGHLPTRGPLGEVQQKYVRNMKAEFNDVIHKYRCRWRARRSDRSTVHQPHALARAVAFDLKEARRLEKPERS